MCSSATDSRPGRPDLLANTRQPDATLARQASERRATAASPDDDGWWREHAGTPATRIVGNNTMRIASCNDSYNDPYNDSHDLSRHQAVNPYRGCEHGCVYCCVRPAYPRLGRSPGNDFETRILHQPDAARLLQRKLNTPGYVCSPINLGTSTDVYQPTERRLQLTRRVLEVLHERKHPATLISKSALIVRDIDLLGAMAQANLVQVTISLSTLDSELASKLEPRAATPQARLIAIRRLSDAGVPVGVRFAPAIPGLTDHEMEDLLAAAFAAGARAASHCVLRLPHEVHALFDQWLTRHAAGRILRVMAILYNKRGGRSNDRCFNSRMRGLGRFADLLEQRFRLACQRIGFADLPELDCRQFCAAPSPADSNAPATAQGRLF